MQCRKVERGRDMKNQRISLIAKLVHAPKFSISHQCCWLGNSKIHTNLWYFSPHSQAQLCITHLTLCKQSISPLTSLPVLQGRNDLGTWHGCTTKRPLGHSWCSTWRGAPRSRLSLSGSMTWTVRWSWLMATPSPQCCSPINVTRRKRAPTTQP